MNAIEGGGSSFLGRDLAGDRLCDALSSLVYVGSVFMVMS
jgi:hypothetical protein